MNSYILRRILELSRIAGAVALLTLLVATIAGAQQQKPANPQLPDPNSQAQQQPASPSSTSPASKSGQEGSQVSAQENGQGQISTQNQQTFTGRITKSKDRFVLKDKTSSMTYKLDRQDLAKEYDGKDVRITGTLDKSDNRIQVSTIEPLSM